MKKLVFIFFFITPLLAVAQLWVEDFSAEVDGATTGTAGGTIGGNWSTTYAGAGTFSKESPLGIELFQVTNTDAEGVWFTSPINISGTGRAIVEATVGGVFVEAGDYIRCYYKVDGGPETLFFEQLGTIASFTLSGTAIVTGSSLEIVVRSTNDGAFDFFTLDDVTVTSVNTIYSRKNGNWNDATIGNGTWSVAGLGGASCDCTPLVTDYVIVGNTNTVDLNVAGTAGGVEIRNTGTLRWTASNIDLNIDRGILQVDLGGTINRNGQTNVQIDFDRGVISTFIVNGSITSEDIEISAADATINLSGSGSINLTDDFLITQDNDIINNNLTGTFSIGDDLIFSQDASQFVNNRTLTVVSDLSAAANTNDDNSFTNSSGATLSLVAFNPNGADFDLFNSGTINQSGNFSNIDAGDTNFDNLAGGVWNWTLTPNTTFDTDIATVMTCTSVSNTFNYSGGGAQRIIPIAYNNLTLSNSGAKDANNSTAISVSGNWTVSGTATFTEGTGTVTFNGAAAQSLTNPSGETFNNLTINNASASGVTFNNAVTVSAVLTMTDGNINLSSTTFIFTSSAAGALVHGLTSASGWMYGGSIRRAFAASTAIAIGNVRGFFPLGTSADFRPFFVGVNSNAGTAGTITVSHTNSTSTSIVSIADATPAATIVRRHDSFWTPVTATISGGTWILRAGGTNFGTVGLVADLRMATSSGVVGTNSAGTGTTIEPLVNRTGLAFGALANNFHVSSTDAASSPLPIELISFNANLKSDVVELDWVTASELNNDFFTIERTSDIEKFENLFIIKGQGTIKSKTNYSFIDESPLSGTSYYRLKQTDFDGKFTYSELRKIKYTISSTRLNVYPNPVIDKTFNLELMGIQPGEVAPVRVVNLQGVSVYNASFKADASGKIATKIELDQVPGGVYMVIVNASSGLRKKIIIP